MISIHLALPLPSLGDSPSSLVPFSSWQQESLPEGSGLPRQAAFREYFSLTQTTLFLLSKTTTKKIKNQRVKRLILNGQQLESLKPVRIFQISSHKGLRRKNTGSPAKMTDKGEAQRNASEGDGTKGTGSGISKGRKQISNLLINKGESRAERWVATVSLSRLKRICFGRLIIEGSGCIGRKEPPKNARSLHQMKTSLLSRCARTYACARAHCHTHTL